MNKAQLTREFDVSLTTISRWIEIGCPYVKKGSNGKDYEFDPEEVRLWRHNNMMPLFTHDSNAPSRKEVAKWGLDMTSALMKFIEKQACKKCRQKFLEHVESGKFHL